MNDYFTNLTSQMNTLNDNIIEELRKNGISDESIEIIKKLYDSNVKLFTTLNFDLVKSDLFIQFNLEMLKHITSLEKVQKDLLNLDDKKRDIFIFMINNFSNNIYWPPYFSALLKNLNSNEFDSLISDININDLEQKDLIRLSSILTSKKNNLNITTQEQLKNYDNILNQMVLNSSDINEYKNAVLLQKFNISLDEAKILCQKYCFDLDGLKTDDTFLEVLKNIKGIVLSNSVEGINNIVNNISSIYLEYPNYQSLSQNLYEEDYNKHLFDPSKIEGKIVDGVKIVDAGTEFCMISRADGAFTGDRSNINTNYSVTWNAPVRTSYSFSNSHISNSRLFMYALQSQKGLLTYAFNNLHKNAIVENALGDNATMITRTKTIDPRAYDDEKSIRPYTFDGCGQRFLPFNSMIDHSSRSVHTEITLERFYYDENGNEKRVEPSYIVYTKIDDNFENDDLYKKSFKAAKEFNIPLVIIDFKKVLESERNKMIHYINQPLSLDNIKKAIQIYSNNSIQRLNENYQSILNSYFPPNTCETMINDFINKAKLQSMPTEFYQELFDFLMELNIEKNVISYGYLVSFKNSFGLNENLDKYYDYIWGITYKELSEKEKSGCLYDYFKWKIIIEKLNKYNINPEKFYSENQYTVNSKIELCEREGIIPTEELLLMDRNEISKYINSQKEAQLPTLPQKSKETIIEKPIEQNIEKELGEFDFKTL